MSVLRHLYAFAVRWSSGEVEGTRVPGRSEAAAEALLLEALRTRSEAEPALGRPRIVPACLLSRLELDHVELDWQRAC